MKKKIQIAAAAIVAILVLIIVLQNTETVETKLLFATISMPRAAMLFGTLLIGFVVERIDVQMANQEAKVTPAVNEPPI